MGKVTLTKKELAEKRAEAAMMGAAAVQAKLKTVIDSINLDYKWVLSEMEKYGEEEKKSKIITKDD